MSAAEVAARQAQPKVGGLLESLWGDRQLRGAGEVFAGGEEPLLAMVEPTQPASELPDAGFRSAVGSVESAEAAHCESEMAFRTFCNGNRRQTSV